MNDPLRVCQKGCLFREHHRFCAWHGTPLRPLVGLPLERYIIGRPISKAGGFGVVYHAQNVVQSEVEAAIKVLKPPHCYRRELKDIFLREAGLGKDIHVTQIPRISSVGDDPFPYIAMEYIEGRTLHEELENRKNQGGQGGKPTWIPVKEAWGILLGIAKALRYGHAVGLIHRDLKPLNIMLLEDRRGDPEDWVKVIDWGIAMKVGLSKSSALQASGEFGKTRQELRKVLEQVGTLEYMAPEHFDGNTDEKSDVYQFGLIAFEVLGGRYPYEPPAAPQRTATAWERIHREKKPKDLRKLRRGIPRQLSRVVHKCLEKDPAKRYSKGGDLYRALLPPKVPRPIKAAIAVLSCMVVGLAVAAWTGIVHGPLPSPDRFFGAETLPLSREPVNVVGPTEGEPEYVFWAKDLDEVKNTGVVPLAIKGPLSNVLCSGSRIPDRLAEIKKEAGFVTAPLSEGGVGFDWGRVADAILKIREASRSRDGPESPVEKYSFAVMFESRSSDGTRQFQRNFQVHLRSRPPEIRSCSVELRPSQGRRVEITLPRAYRIYCPTQPVGLKTVVEVAEIDTEDIVANVGFIPKTQARASRRPGIWVSLDRDGKPIFDVRVTAPEDQEKTNRYTLDPDSPGDRPRLPPMPPPSDTGESVSLKVTVVDKAHNETLKSATLIFDSGPAVRSADTLTFEKEPGGRAAIAVPLEEAAPLTPDRFQLRLTDKAGKASENLPIQELDRDNGAWKLRAQVNDVLKRLETSGAKGPFYLSLTFDESFDNLDKSSGSSGPGLLKPREFPQCEVTPDNPDDLVPEDFDFQVELAGAARKPLQLIRAHETDAEGVFRFRAKEKPTRLFLGPRHQDKGNDKERDKEQPKIDWSVNAEVPSKAGFEIRKASANAASGTWELPGDFPVDDPVSLELKVQTFWGAEKSFHLELLYSQDLPRFFERDGLRLLPGKGQPAHPLGFGAPKDIHILKADDLEVEIDVRPEDGEVILIVEKAELGGPREIQKHRWGRNPPGANGPPWRLVNGQGLPLEDGIYVLKFTLRDVFGNQASFPLHVLSLHGECPKVGDCSLNALQAGSCPVEWSVKDASGINYLQMRRDDAPPVDFNKEELGSLAAEGLQPPPSAKGGVIITDRDRVRTGDGQAYLTELRITWNVPVGSSAKFSVSASDFPNPNSRQPACAAAVCEKECKSFELPESVEFWNVSWFLVGQGKEQFYVCQYEVSKDFYDKPEQGVGAGDQAKPWTEGSPRQMWKWATDRKLYLPTQDQWRLIKEKIVRGRKPQHVELKPLEAVVNCREAGKPLMRVSDTSGWDGKEEARKNFPFALEGALHFFGNAGEVVVDVVVKKGAESVLDKAYFAGGNRMTSFVDCQNDPMALTYLDKPFPDTGFRVIAYPQPVEGFTVNEQLMKAIDKKAREKK